MAITDKQRVAVRRALRALHDTACHGSHSALQEAFRGELGEFSEKFSEEQLEAASASASRVQAELTRHRKLVAEYSGKPHHQGCPIGGVKFGFRCDISGGPCWCGASETE